MKTYTFRAGTLDDRDALQQLFVGTIKTVCIKDYNSEQIEMWSSSIHNEQRWADILIHQFVLIALHGSKIVGFCTLDKWTYIDLLFVHKDYQRIKVAQQLYHIIEDAAKRQHIKSITADVSKTAKSFFEKMGFSTVQKQVVRLKEIKFINYKMIKNINA